MITDVPRMVELQAGAHNWAVPYYMLPACIWLISSIPKRSAIPWFIDWVSQYKGVNIDIGLVRFVIEVQADAACSYVILGEPISFYKKKYVYSMVRSF